MLERMAGKGMMKTIITAIILMISVTAHGQVGLPDAIEALQVVAGVRTITANTVSIYSHDIRIPRLVDGEYVELVTVPEGQSLHITSIMTAQNSTSTVSLHLNSPPNGLPFSRLKFGEGGYPGSTIVDFWVFAGETLRVKFKGVGETGPVWMDFRFIGQVFE